MTNRINNKDLEQAVERLNLALGAPLNQHTILAATDTARRRVRANVGNYHIEGAYGGVKLCRVETEGGGSRDISSDGYGTKRQLWTAIQHILRGVELTTGQTT